MSEAKMLKSAETLASLVYTRDNDGQVKKTTAKSLPGAEITENTYDANNRLTKSGSEYKYDSANNPTTIGAGTYKYDKGSELETGPSLTYTYNELGERTKTKPTAGPAMTYGYDQAGNLTSVERPKEGEVSEIKDTYAYNGEGLRDSQTISGTTTHLAWDVTEGLPLMLSDETNSYIYGPGGLPVEQVSSGGTVTYLHHDQQGSTRLLTGSAGTVTGSTTFDAYGNKTGSTGCSTTPLGYDGQYTSSDTGLIYMRARVYDPVTAQFLSVDPIAPISLAPYNYAYDSPVNAVDPTGLLSWEDVSEAAAGALDALTFGGSTHLAGKIFGFNADCASFGTAGEIGAVLGLGLGLFDGETEAELAAEGANLARNVGGGLTDAETALSGAGRWLGQDYREIAPGVFRSSDGLRQVRLTSSDLGHSTPHIHFESVGPGGRGKYRKCSCLSWGIVIRIMQSKRLVAVIRREDVKLPSRNFVGLPPMEPGEPDTRRRLPIPLVIVVSTKRDGIFLERFDEAGADAGDSWHQSIEEAKEQACEEYGESIGVWTPVPDSEEDPVAFGLRLADVDL